jgi:hypothetical protein
MESTGPYSLLKNWLNSADLIIAEDWNRKKEMGGKPWCFRRLGAEEGKPS